MTCSTTGYTGQNFCNKKSRFGKPTGLIFARSSHTETSTDFLSESTWIDEVKAQNVFPLHNMKNFEDNSTEPQYYEYADGSRKLMEQGDYRFTASFDLNECTKKQVANFRGFNEGIYLVYGDVIRGRTIDAGVNIVPIRISELNVAKASFPAMDGTPEMVAITVDLADYKDINDYDYSREMAWDVADVDGLTEVTLTTSGTPTASEIIVDVSAECGGNSKEISGLGTAITDWVVSAGTISSVTESSTVRGRYTIAGSLMAGTIDLAAPVDRSDDVLVISSGAISTGI
jgi:hypothetical protein